MCPDCECIRSLRSRHCSICDKCVERYDHHCPWVNNCIGTRNHFAFYCFISLIVVQLFYSASLTGICTVVKYNLVLSEGYEVRNKRFFPDIEIINFICKYELLFYISLIGLTLYFTVFSLMVFVLWLIQTKNLLSGRTTYERFSNAANLAFDGMYGEIVSKYSDSISLRNCVFMCCKCEIPIQDELEEAQLKEKSRSNSSILSNSCNLEIDAQFFDKLIYTQEYYDRYDNSVLKLMA